MPSRTPAGADAASARPATVLVVDDTPDNLVLISDLLRPHYRVKVATRGAVALEIVASAQPPDLVLLDVMMPEMDGYEVCTRIKDDARTRDIPVIFLTARTDPDDECRGLALGGADYITKPINPPILMARIHTQLALKASSDFLRDQNAYLEAEVSRRTREVLAIQDVTIQALAALAETRDTDTGNHIRRTQHYVHLLADRLRDAGWHAETLTEDYLRMLYRSAPLHDIGKVGIPDRILLKPGRLTADEFDVMKSHAVLGRDAIAHAERTLGMSVEFLQMAKAIAHSHQEKWDGSGYPQGLAGEAIPLPARLMAVADVYDALISRRVYKAALPHDAAVAEMRRGRGTHFEPAVVDMFVEHHDAFAEIAAQFADSDEDLARKRALLRQAAGLED